MGLTPEALLARVATCCQDVTCLPVADMRGQAVAVVPRERSPEVLRTLRDDPDLRLDLLSDLTAVDYLGRTPRFELVYQLVSTTAHHRLRVKVPLDESDLVAPTASGLWKSALWAEREVWDLFGIQFAGHPDLRRILLYPEFEGHPLRKDYPTNRRWPLVPERDPIRDPWRARGGR